VDDFKERVPPAWIEHGGVLLPLYQSESLWLNFKGHNATNQGIYPFAVKISTGKLSALTGAPRADLLKEKDYCVVPKQPWIDGYVVDGNTIRQFVAAPLGMGFTAEEQITGKAEFGGIQIEVFPMKRDVFDRRFPKREPTYHHDSFMMRSAQTKDFMGGGQSYGLESFPAARSKGDVRPDMGLAPGGRMKQEIYEDPYEFTDWDQSNRGRCYVHLANSLAWKSITQKDPPTAPRTAADYAHYNLPWFQHYDDGPSLSGTAVNQNLKGVAEIGSQKGFSILPENESVDVPGNKIVKTGPNAVRDGSWT
jgi:hypothetical protein